ncbi:MAG: hypothetical protein V5A72_02805 [Candidatus Nanohaloarchaea archaeon]
MANLSEKISGEVELYTGEEIIHPKIEQIMSEIDSDYFVLNLPITAIDENKEFIRENREKFKLKFYIEREIPKPSQYQIKETLKNMKSKEKIIFDYCINDGFDQDLFLKQIAAILPDSGLEIVISNATQEKVDRALRLAGDVLVISRRGILGIRGKIQNQLKNRKLEEEIFQNRKSQIKWVGKSRNNKKYFRLEN